MAVKNGICFGQVTTKPSDWWDKTTLSALPSRVTDLPQPVGGSGIFFSMDAQVGLNGLGAIGRFNCTSG